MTTFTSNQFGDLAMAPHSAGELYLSDDIVSLPVTLAADDLSKVGYLPAGCVPVDFTVVSDELDAHETDTLKFSVGLLNDDGDDLVSASTFITGATADAAVNVVRGNAAGMGGIAPDEDDDRILAVKITTVAATKKAGDMRVIMTYRASNYGA